MASITLQVAPTFPVGTSVSAYKASDWNPAIAPSGSPPGSAVASATVAAAGTLTFAGLTEGTTYFAYASVSSQDRYLRFRLDSASGTAAVAYSGAKVHLNTNDSIPNNTITARTFNAELWDTDGWHSTAANTTRITVPAGKAGIIELTAQVTYEGNTTGTRQVRILKNGTTTIAFASQPTTAVGVAVPQVAVRDNAIVGDYYEVMCFQDSGILINSTGDATGTLTWFGVHYEGALPS